MLTRLKIPAAEEDPRISSPSSWIDVIVSRWRRNFLSRLHHMTTVRINPIQVVYITSKG